MLTPKQGAPLPTLATQLPVKQNSSKSQSLSVMLPVAGKLVKAGICDAGTNVMAWATPSKPPVDRVARQERSDRNRTSVCARSVTCSAVCKHVSRSLRKVTAGDCVQSCVCCCAAHQSTQKGTGGLRSTPHLVFVQSLSYTSPGKRSGLAFAFTLIRITRLWAELV